LSSRYERNIIVTQMKPKTSVVLMRKMVAVTLL
jgi:hypothetical protein